MQECETLRTLRRVEQETRESRRTHDRADAVLSTEFRRDLFAEAIPLFEFRVERLQEQNRASRFDRIERIEQQHRAWLIADTREVLEVRMRTELAVNARVHVACEYKRDGILQRLEDMRAARGVGCELDAGEMGRGCGVGRLLGHSGASVTLDRRSAKGDVTRDSRVIAERRKTPRRRMKRRRVY